MRPINLLPPEAFEKAKTRRRAVKWIALGAMYLVVLAFLTVWWQGRVTAKEDAVAEQQEINQSIEQQVAALADAQDLVNTYLENVLMVQMALLTDVSWGRILNDLARMLPERVWLEGFDGGIAFSEESTAVGAITVTGVGFGYPDVAAWLRALDSDRFPSVDATWVTGSSRTAIGEFEVVGFQSSASLTPDSLSSRVLERIPEVAP